MIWWGGRRIHTTKDYANYAENKFHFLPLEFIETIHFIAVNKTGSQSAERSVSLVLISVLFGLVVVLGPLSKCSCYYYSSVL